MQSMMYKIVLLVGIVAICLGVYYKEIGVYLVRYKSYISSEQSQVHTAAVMFEEHLVKYKHLAVLGHVFDVSSAPKFYGEKGHYNFFTGLDATRAFANSDLSGKSFISTVDGLPASDVRNAFNWLSEFKEKYPLVGLLHGLYFDNRGNPTEYFISLKEAVAQYEQNVKAEDEMYPVCNFFSSGSQNEVDCIKGFDGERFPRLFKTPTSRSPRCVCLTHNFLNTGKALQYPRCSEMSRKCTFTTEELDRLISEFKGH